MNISNRSKYENHRRCAANIVVGSIPFIAVILAMFLLPERSERIAGALALAFIAACFLLVFSLYGRGLLYRRVRKGSEIHYRRGEPGDPSRTFSTNGAAYYIPRWELLPGLGSVVKIDEHPV